MADMRVFHHVRQVAVLAACLVGLAACNGPGCSLVGAPSGVSLAVDADLAAATTAVVSVCAGSDCRDVEVELRTATAPRASSCSGDSCGAALEPTGGKSGFASLAVPRGAVRVAVELLDTAGGQVYSGSADTAAKTVTAPCGDSGEQIALTVSPTGVR